MVGKRGGKPSRKKATVSSQFKVSTAVYMAGKRVVRERGRKPCWGREEGAIQEESYRVK